MKTAQVYWIRLPSHTSPATQGYIGFTTQPLHRRFRHHVRNMEKHRSMSSMLERILRQRGPENVIVETLVIGDAGYCLEVEGKLRPRPHVGWNLCAGGRQGALGLKRRPETIEKRAAKLRGLPRSEETKAKLREALKGNKCAAGSVRTAKMRAAHAVRHTGFKHTEEAKAKISASLIGNKRAFRGVK